MITNKKIQILKFSIIISVIFIFYSLNSTAYKMAPPDTVVHQHITKESGEVWSSIPYEIKTKSSNDIDDLEIDSNYDLGDDIITGSEEEDKALSTILFALNEMN